MEKEQEYKIGANAYEFVQKHRSNLSHAKQAELQAMLKDFAIEQVKNSVVLADVSGCPKCGSHYKAGQCWKYTCSNEKCGYTPKHLG